MKVLHVVLGLGNGGAEGALFRLVLADTENEHVIISIMGDGVYGERLRNAGIELHSFDVPRGKIKISAIFQTYKLIKRIRPDVVQTWLYHADLLGGILAKAAGVRSIVWGIRHSNLDPKLNSRLTVLMAKLSAVLSKFVPSKIISCSIKAAEVHQAIGYRKDKFAVIPNGYDLNKLKYSESSRSIFREKWGVKDSEFLFGMIGRWTPLKDHKNLFMAISILSKASTVKFKCALVGSSIDKDNNDLISLIDEFGIADYVLLTGSVTDVSVPLSGFDALVLPSAGEAFPNVVAEAMACSKPCVVTDVGDAAYIVDAYGWVVPPKNSQALASAMVKAITLYENLEKWQSLQLACRERIVNNFSIDAMKTSFVGVWQSTLIR